MTAPAHSDVDVPFDVLQGFTHRMVDVDGVSLHAVDGGVPGARTVVLLAGAPQTWWAWRLVMPVLAGAHRVVALDLPGQGHSDRPADGYDTRSVARVVRRAVEILGVGEHWLVAHDIGAWVAVTYALDAPAAGDGPDLLGLALLDAGIPGVSLPTSVSLDPASAQKLAHFAFNLVPDLPETLISGHERDYVAWFLTHKAASADVFSDADIDRYARLFAAAGGVRAILAYYRAAPESARQNRELAARRRIDVPVAAVSAEHGSIPDMAAAVRPLVGDAADVLDVRAAGAGHFVPEEAPGQVVGAIEELVARSRP
ncbi:MULTISPECIES: alpha/beta fold hydrolase [unclassified Pseudonocardia]|uniref:alpha/beta fold hydrolase n=1 Tax=unclassified Pseudonocardia TaxID=2619320 RepID=UPI001CF6FBA3|nr:MULTISPECIES: alpha/beta hydrolase [unclassified Pseudonocardia]